MSWWHRSPLCSLSSLRKHDIAVAQVTKVKLAQKQKEGIAEARSGRRTVVSAFHHGPSKSP